MTRLSHRWRPPKRLFHRTGVEPQPSDLCPHSGGSPSECRVVRGENCTQQECPSAESSAITPPTAVTAGWKCVEGSPASIQARRHRPPPSGLARRRRLHRRSDPHTDRATLGLFVEVEHPLGQGQVIQHQSLGRRLNGIPGQATHSFPAAAGFAVTVIVHTVDAETGPARYRRPPSPPSGRTRSSRPSILRREPSSAPSTRPPTPIDAGSSPTASTSAPTGRRSRCLLGCSPARTICSPPSPATSRSPIPRRPDCHRRCGAT
jgi:hypothetical protein